MTIELIAKSATITTLAYGRISIECEGVDINDVIKDVGVDDLLDAIGRDYVMEYFNIEENESDN